MTKNNILSLLIVLLLPLLFLLGWIEQNNFKLKYELIWSQNKISWSDFKRVDSLPNDYAAVIDSKIYCPNYIPRSNFNIYAYMNPETSLKLQDSFLNDYTLQHEQYHFNITEYHARLLRRDIIKTGKEKLTEDVFDSLFVKYDNEKTQMQIAYDSITDHSLNNLDQRYWELKLDDLMRQTAYFENKDIYGYYNFKKGNTDYYRHIYKTFNYNILPSYPIYKSETAFGEAYKIINEADEVIIEFYKNGILSNGGEFNTAITSIKKTDSLIEIRYYNPDKTLNDQLSFAIFKRLNTPNKKTDSYYNSKEERVSDHAIYQTVSTKISDTQYATTYFNKDMASIINKDGVFKKERTLDSLGRTIKIAYLNLNNSPALNDTFSSKIEKEYNSSHRLITYKEYDEKGAFSENLFSYNDNFKYDERGNIKTRTNYNQKNEIAPNKNGVAIYEYTYDKFNNETSRKRFNKFKNPIRETEGYFMDVTEYDQEERVVFYAKYLPEYTLDFDDYKWGATQYVYPNDSTILIKNLDAYNNIFNSTDGIAIHKKHLNKEGKVERLFYLDSDNNFAKTDNAIVETRYVYDEKGNTLQEATFDSLSNLKAFDFDVAMIKWTYDENNNKIKTAYYNILSELADAKQNVTFNIYKYNNKNQMVERTNFNKDMEPVLFDNYFKSQSLFNRFGKDSIVYNFDAYNKPLSSVFKTTYTYNKFSNLISESYFNEDNVHIPNENGIATVEYLYNSQQEYIGYAYFDIFGKRTNDLRGISYNMYKLNTSGYVLSNSYYNKDGNPTFGPDGYHKLELIWNDKAEKINAKIFGLQKQLIPDEEGVAEYVYTSGASGLFSSIKRYDAFGQLTNNIYGIAETYYRPGLNGLYYTDYELDYLGNAIIEIEEENIE